MADAPSSTASTGQAEAALSSSPIISIHSLSRTGGASDPRYASSSLAAFEDGALSLFRVSDETPRVAEFSCIKLQSTRVAHAAAAIDESRPTDFFFALARERAASALVGMGRGTDDGGIAWEIISDVALDSPATAIAFDGKMRRFACGSASGVVQVYDLSAAAGASATWTRAREFELVRSDGPTCHSVAFWPHHNDVVIAAGCVHSSRARSRKRSRTRSRTHARTHARARGGSPRKYMSAAEVIICNARNLDGAIAQQCRSPSRPLRIPPAHF
jgi:WD40 repeat protein